MSSPDPSLVSVVIPARNEAGRIGALVVAVLAQDPRGRRIEVIVVDDGSTDGTVAEARAAGVQSASRNTIGSPPASAAPRLRPTAGFPVTSPGSISSTRAGRRS